VHTHTARLSHRDPQLQADGRKDIHANAQRAAALRSSFSRLLPLSLSAFVATLRMLFNCFSF